MPHISHMTMFKRSFVVLFALFLIAMPLMAHAEDASSGQPQTDWKVEMWKRLDVIGQKLGVAAEHLWALLIKQAYVESVAQLVAGLIILTAATVLIVIFKRAYSKASKYDGEGFMVGMILTPVLGYPLGLMLALFGGMGMANPEYYALKDLIEMLKSVH